MSLAVLGGCGRLAVARLRAAQDRGLAELAVESAALVGPIVLVRERPQDAGAGAGGGAGRQHRRAGPDHAGGYGEACRTMAAAGGAGRHRPGVPSNTAATGQPLWVTPSASRSEGVPASRQRRVAGGREQRWVLASTTE